MPSPLWDMRNEAITKLNEKTKAAYLDPYQHTQGMFGPEQMRKLMEFFNKYRMGAAQPYIDQYQTAMQRYDQALPQYMQQMGQAGQTFEDRMKMLGQQYGGAARGAASGAYTAGQAALGRGQNQIDQSIRARLAQSGMGGTGMGAAQGALGSAASSYAAPGLYADYSRQLGDIAGSERDFGAGVQQTMLGHRTGMADTGMGFEQSRLGAQNDFMKFVTDLQTGGMEMGQETLNLLAQLWSHMQSLASGERMQKESGKFDLGNFLANIGGGALSVLPGIGKGK